MQDRFGDRWNRAVQRKPSAEYIVDGIIRQARTIQIIQIQSGNKGIKVLILLLPKLSVNNLDILN